MKLPSLPDTIRGAAGSQISFIRFQQIAAWCGRLLIAAAFLSNAFAFWVALPGHEKASRFVINLHQFGSSSSFRFPIVHECAVGFPIAAMAAALTSVILRFTGVAPYQTGADFLFAGWAMWFGIHLLHHTQH